MTRNSGQQTPPRSELQTTSFVLKSTTSLKSMNYMRVRHLNVPLAMSPTKAEKSSLSVTLAMNFTVSIAKALQTSQSLDQSKFPRIEQRDLEIKLLVNK